MNQTFRLRLAFQDPDRRVCPGCYPHRVSTPPDDRNAGTIQSVERATAILRAFGEARQQISITEVADLLGIHRTTASRLVGTLIRVGLLERGADDGSIGLGPELRRLGRLAAGEASLAEISRASLDELARQTGETATLSIREGGYAVNIAQSGGTHRIGVQSWVGARTPLTHTADGKVLLAFGDDEPEDLTDRQSKALRLIREQEWAASQGELEENLYGVAVPVWDASGRCLAALCVSGPSYRVTVDRFESLADQCRHVAYQIFDRHQHYREHTS